MYEHNIRLFCSSEGLPFELFQHILTRSQAKEPKAVEVCALRPIPYCSAAPYPGQSSALQRLMVCVNAMRILPCSPLNSFRVPLCWDLPLVKLTRMKPRVHVKKLMWLTGG